jgi:hypothetical protein
MSYLSKLLPASTEIIVSNGVQVGLFGLSINRIAFGVDDLIPSALLLRFT